MIELQNFMITTENDVAIYFFDKIKISHIDARKSRMFRVSENTVPE